MRLVRIALAALVCVALYPSLASAQDEAFKKGLQARGAKNWNEMARQMRSALQASSTESTTKKVKTSGFLGFGKETEYLPHFFLGEALKSGGDCAGAVSEWLISEQQKAVQSKPEYYDAMLNGLRECAAKGVLLRADFDEKNAATRQVYDNAAAIANRITDRAKSYRELWPPFAAQYDTANKELESAHNRLNVALRTRVAADFNEAKAASERATAILKPIEEGLNTTIENVASLQQRIRDLTDAITTADALDKSIDGIKSTLTEPQSASRKVARDQVGQARDKLSAAKTPNATTVNEAMKLVQSATGAFNQVIDQLNRQKHDELGQRLSFAMRSTDEGFASVSTSMATLEERAARKPDKITPEIATQRDAIRKQIEAQRQRYTRALKSEDVPGIDSVRTQLIEVQAALNKIIQAFGPLSLRDRGVHAGLEEGARLFLAGDYQKALAALDPATGVDDAASPSLQLQAHLFRAASAFALYVRSGEGRQEWRTQALAEIDRCKQIDATFEPSTQVFAPRFITLYKTGGAAAQTAAVTQ